MDKSNIEFHNMDCMRFMENVENNAYEFVLTDIPYDGVNRKSNGLRKLDKGKADVLSFDLDLFLEQVYRVCSGSIVIFCGMNQLSTIFDFFSSKKGTVRSCVWHKTNPSPMNGQNIYLSALEHFVWFKKPGATFNANCKHNVFTFPAGRAKLHPTEKNHKLLEDLIVDNTNIGDTVFDPCAGSASTLLVANKLGRHSVGCELDEEFYLKANDRLTSTMSSTN